MDQYCSLRKQSETTSADPEGGGVVEIDHLTSVKKEIHTGHLAQSVTVMCLATDVSLTADPGVASSIPAWSHAFVEIDYCHYNPFC